MYVVRGSIFRSPARAAPLNVTDWRLDWIRTRTVGSLSSREIAVRV